MGEGGYKANSRRDARLGVIKDDEMSKEMNDIEKILQRQREKRKEENANRKFKDLPQSNSRGADWTEVDGVLIAKAVAVVGRMGGALRLGYTRDGGAYAVGVYGDGDPFTKYCPPGDEIESLLRRLIETYE